MVSVKIWKCIYLSRLQHGCCFSDTYGLKAKYVLLPTLIKEKIGLSCPCVRASLLPLIRFETTVRFSRNFMPLDTFLLFSFLLSVIPSHLQCKLMRWERRVPLLVYGSEILYNWSLVNIKLVFNFCSVHQQHGGMRNLCVA